MRDYNYREKWQKLLIPEIVKKLTLIHEYKGEQRLFIEAHKDELNELVEIAKVQSTEACSMDTIWTEQCFVCTECD